tara:strand:+ start:217 stop:417 length:201 start_codon:yes stop_codon:yes gene_type:complete
MGATLFFLNSDFGSDFDCFQRGHDSDDSEVFSDSPHFSEMILFFSKRCSFINGIEHHGFFTLSSFK